MTIQYSPANIYMHMCIYICLWASVYTHICTHMCIYVYASMYAHVHRNYLVVVLLQCSSEELEMSNLL